MTRVPADLIATDASTGATGVSAPHAGKASLTTASSSSFDRGARLARSLGAGLYRVEAPSDEMNMLNFLCGWGAGQYRYPRHTRRTEAAASVRRICGIPASPARAALTLIRADWLARDLINCPPNLLGPGELAEAARAVAQEFGATLEIVSGTDLDEGYPLVAAVGGAAARAPLLIDLRWGDPAHPRVTLVGKGVCFDSGGLNIKSVDGMALMKKDMAGAAQALALARAVMESRLPIRLRLLIPAVENLIGPLAMRPQDVLRSRSGLTVELDDTDAEGRLILADALFEADRESPALIVDFATLTSAQRIACGFGVAGFFSNDEPWAARYEAAARASEDPVWRLPLHQPYRTRLASAVADLSNCGQRLQGGAIHAALFLQSFLPQGSPWIHVDFMGWNTDEQDALPSGAICQGLRAAFGMLCERYPPANN